MIFPRNNSNRWPWITLAFVFTAHLILVIGLRQTFDSFIALVGGILTGLAAFGSWRFRPGLWRTPWTSVLLAGVIVVEVVEFEEATRPPPPPEPFAISRLPDGTYLLNRGGELQYGRVYLVLPDPGSIDRIPRILGAVRVTKIEDDYQARISWITMRHSYRDHPRYLVRPLRPGERIPSSRQLVTLLNTAGPGRARIDSGSAQGVKENDVYALYHQAGRGWGGYLVVDTVDPNSAEGYLASASPEFPHDADRIGVLTNVAQAIKMKAEVAFMSGRLEDARKDYLRVAALTAGKDERTADRLELLAEELGPLEK